MKKNLLLIMLFFGMVSINAQTVFDYETPETIIPFQLFGGDQEGIVLDPVANPNPSGINTSATVYPFTELANSETFAGGFSNPDPSGGIDATNGGQICFDALFTEANSITVKIENGNAEVNWELTQQNDVLGEWTTMCYDLSIVGEGNGAVAIGNMYTRLVLFIGLGDNTAQVVHVDNFKFPDSGTAPIEGDVTFSVDMNNFSEAFTTPFVSGTFNDWSGDANPLSDDDGDGVWSTTLTLDAGSYEYKFTLDNWAFQEQFSRTSACTVTTDDGNGGIFTNRALAVTGDATEGTFCFNSCYACGAGVNITFNLGVTDAADSGVFLAGGAEFGAPGGNFQMSDDDNDGIFTISIERQMGFEGFYTFTNGNCPDFSCKENIAGQDCANPDNFNDRFIPAVMADATINTCFAECTTDTNCTAPPEPTMTTFSVDVNQVSEVDAEGIFIAGQFSNWANVAMSDDDGDGIWTIGIELAKTTHEYKFRNGMESEEVLEAGSSCTITTPDGMFTNRLIDLTAAEATSEADIVCYESCAQCTVGTDDLEANNNLIKLYPTIAQDMMYLDVLTTFDNGTVQIISLQGALMNTIQIGNNTTGNAIEVANYPQGTYMLSLTTDTFRSTQRFVKM